MSKIEELTRDELVATDEGTHGMPETLRIYQRLDGSMYGVRSNNGVNTIVAANAESTYGRMRHLKYRSPAERKALIHAEEKQIEANAKAENAKASRKADLERGWDGYRFIGIEEGKKLAASM